MEKASKNTKIRKEERECTLVAGKERVVAL